MLLQGLAQAAGWFGSVFEDVLIFSGLALMVGATFHFGVTAGLYAAGAASLGVGLFFARYPPRRRR